MLIPEELTFARKDVVVKPVTKFHSKVFPFIHRQEFDTHFTAIIQSNLVAQQETPPPANLPWVRDI